MTPTPKLRWVRRGYDDDNKVLQQWWTPDGMTNHHQGEWRDVPLEEET